MQYFGITEEEQTPNLDEGILGVESLAGLEQQAKRLAVNAMQSAGFDDVGQLQDAIRTGATRVSS